MCHLVVSCLSPAPHPLIKVPVFKKSKREAKILIAITTSKNTCTRIQNNTLVIKKDRREEEIK